MTSSFLVQKFFCFACSLSYSNVVYKQHYATTVQNLTAFAYFGNCASK